MSRKTPNITYAYGVTFTEGEGSDSGGGSGSGSGSGEAGSEFGYLYDGIDDSHVAQNINVGTTGLYAISLFLKPISSFVEGLICNYGNGTNSSQGRGNSLIQQGDGSLRMRHYDGADGFNDFSVGLLTIDVWNHVCIVFGGASQGMYINNNAEELSLDPPAAQNSTDDFIIAGTLPDDAAEFSPYAGAIAQVAYWTGAVPTTGEIASLNAKSICPTAINSSNLRLFLKLTEADAIDSSSNGFTVVKNSSPTLTAGPTGLAC